MQKMLYMEMWMPVSVILTRSAWCLGDWRLSQRQRWQIELVQKKAQILSDFIQEVSFFAKARSGDSRLIKNA